MTPGAALLCLVAVALPPGSPLLDERVLVVGGEPQRAALIEAALRARGLRVLEPGDRAGLDGRDARVPVGDREVARTRLLAARAAWRQLELDAAADAVAATLEEALRLERPEDHLDLIVDALLLRATVELSRGGDAEALRDVRLATRLEPERETLDAALHPPSLVEAWTRARAGAHVAVVVVRPRLRGDGEALVHIDGRPASTRDGLLELAVGPHLLTVRAEGCRSTSRVIDVGGDDTAIEDVLTPDTVIAARAQAVARVAAGDADGLVALAPLADVDVVVGLEVGGPGRPVVVSRAGAPARDVAVDAVAPPAAIADAILRTLAPSTPEAPPTAPTTPTDDVNGVLVAGGVVGAALVVGGAVTVAWLVWPGQAPAPPPRPVVLTCCTQ